MNIEQVDIVKYGFSILQIETMSLCNMRCEFCSYPLRLDKGKVLPEKAVLDIVDSISMSDGFKHICLSQLNEPLLDNRIYKFIKHIKDRKLHVTIITNGLLFDSKEVIDRLIDAGPDYIKVSLQVLNSELFSRVRKAGCDFQKYKQGIIDFLKAARGGSSKITIDIACNFLSGTSTLKRLLGLEYGDPSIYDTIDDLRVDCKHFLKGLEGYLPSYIFNDADIDDYLADVSSNYLHEPGLKIEKNISLKIKPFIYGRRIEEFYPVKRTGPCNSKILGILASGNVVPCCMAYNGFLSLGNVLKEPLGVILERSSKLFNNIRKGSNVFPACQHCLGAPTKRGVILKELKGLFF